MASGPTASRSTGNDPNDANVPVDSTFQKGWVQHLVSQWGAANAGGVKYYILDNEPSIWHRHTSRRHSDGRHHGRDARQDDRLRGKIKDVDPGRRRDRPRGVGLERLLLERLRPAVRRRSRLDAAFRTRRRTAASDYLPWLLDQMHQHDVQTGGRLLDYFHGPLLPAGRASSATTSPTGMQLSAQPFDPLAVGSELRRPELDQRPRQAHPADQALGWQPTIPGRRSGITEYNWGAEGHMNGATTQADIFGIFGREGLDMARALDHAGSQQPHVQGDQDLPQLRRKPLEIRRHQRFGDGPESGLSSRRSRRNAAPTEPSR